MLNYFAKRKIEKLSKEELIQSIEETQLAINQLNNDIEKLETNKQALLERNNQKISDFQSESLKTKENLKNKIAKLSEEIAKVNEEIKLKQNEKAELISHSEDKLQLLEDVKRNRQKEIDNDYEERLKKIETAHQEAVSQKENEFSAYREQAKLDHEAEIERIKSDLSELNNAYGQIENDHNNDMGVINHDFSFSCDDERNINKSLTEKKNQIIQAEAMREQTRNDNLKNIKADYEQAYAALKVENQKEYDKMKENFEKELSEYQNELLILKKENQDIDNEYRKALSLYKSDEERLNNEVQRIHNELVNDRKLLEAQKNDAAERLSALQNQLESLNQEISDRKIAFDNEISSKTAQDGVDLEKYLADKEKQLKDREEANQANLDGLENNYKELKLQLNQDYTNEVGRYEDEYRLNQKRYLAKTRELYKNQDEVKSGLQNRLNELKVANLRLNDQIDKLNTTCETKNREYEQLVEAERLKWESILDDEKDKHLAKLDALKAEGLKHQQDFEKAKGELIAQSEALKKDRDFEEMVNNQNKQKLEAELQAIHQEREIELERLEKENTELTSRLTEISSKLEDTKTAKENLIQEFDNKRADYQKEYEIKVAKINAEHDNELAALESKFNGLSDDLSTKMAEATEKHQEALGLLKQEYDGKTAELETEYQIEVNKINQDLEAYQNANQSEIDENTAKQAELENNLTKLNTTKENMADEHQHKMETLISDYRQKLGDLHVKFQNLSEEIKNDEAQKSAEYAEEEVNLQNEIERIRNEIEEVRTSGLKEKEIQEQKMVELNHNFSIKISDINTLIKTNREENQTLEKRYSEVLNQIETMKAKKNEEFDAFACDLKNKLLNVEEDYAAQIKEIDANYCRDYNSKVEENKLELNSYATEIEQKSFDYDLDIQKHKDDNNEKIKLLQVEHQKIKDGLKEQLVGAENDTKALEDKLVETKNANEVYFAELQAAFDQKHADLDEEFNAVSKANQIEVDNAKHHANERLMALNAHNDEIKQHIQDLVELKRQEVNLNNDNLAVMNQSLKFKESELIKNLADCQSELNQIERYTSTLKANFNLKVEAMYQELQNFENKRIDYEKQHAEELGKAKRHFEKTISQKREAFETQLSNLESHQKELLDSLNMRENIIVEKYKQNILDIECAFQMSVREAQEKLDAFHAEHIEFMNAETYKQDQVNAEIEKAHAEVETEQQAFREKNAVLEAKQVANIETAEQHKDAKISNIVKKTNIASELIEKEKQDLLEREYKLKERFANIDQLFNEKFDECLALGNDLLSEYESRLDAYHKIIEKTEEPKKGGFFGFGRRK